MDAVGNAYVAGETASNEKTFPVIVGPDLKANGGTQAYLYNVSGLDIGGADVFVKATSSKSVLSKSTASLLAIGISGLEEASAISGGGAFSVNQILGSTTAYIESSEIDEVGSVDLDAIDRSKIDSTVTASADSLAISLFDNASAQGFGISGAMNLIGAGFDLRAIGADVELVGGDRLDVSAYVKDTSVNAARRNHH